jgi:anthranilate synthase/phosphoribosyltransferase
MLKKILMLDNFDSFTYNLVDFFRQLGCDVKVYRNTAPLSALEAEDFDLLVLSPGPSVPRNAGNMMQAIARFAPEKPILGVCLGHQALIEHFGGTLANIAPVHGKSVPIEHDGRGIFTGIEQHCPIARYHSWAGDEIPAEFEVTARSADGVVMAVRHKRLPIEGIQFHPESVLSMKNGNGMKMLRNVVEGRMAAGNRIYHNLAMQLQNGQALPPETLQAFLAAVNEGQLSEEQKYILLTGLSIRLRNTGELTRFIQALMAFSNGKNLENLASEAVDICGTGGSGLPRINTSTLAALLLAPAGLKIAKHGNRAAAGRFGSFNLLETLQVPIRFDPERAVETLEKLNLTFIFAPDVHPVFRHFAPARTRIGVPTVFNVLGPLVNPLQPRRQFIGTAFADLMDVIFETGIQMGKEHLIVVRGYDGLDEISATTPTRVLEYKNGQKSDYEISPSDFGIKSLPAAAASAVNAETGIGIAKAMISGLPTTDHYQLVCLNAAFIYSKFVENIPLPDAYRKMENMLRSGVMGEVLEQYRQAYRVAAPSNKA